MAGWSVTAPHRAHERGDLGHGLVTVGRGEPGEETLARHRVPLRADGPQEVCGQHRTHLGAAFVPEAAGESDEEASAEGVADARGVNPLDVTGDGNMDGVLAAGADVGAVLAARDDAGRDPAVDLVLAPPGLGLGEVGLVLVGEQVVRAVDELADEGAFRERELLRRVGDEADAARAALLGVAQHGLGVVGTDEHEVEVPPLVDRAELDHPRLGHRAGVERGDLRHRVICRADEARRVP